MNDLTPSSENSQADRKYDPNYLLDFVIDKLKLKNDAALARILGITPPVLSRIRHRKLPVGATVLVAMHEETGLSVRALRRLMGDYSDKFGRSAAHIEPK